MVVSIKTVVKHAKVKSNPQTFETLPTKSHKVHMYIIMQFSNTSKELTHEVLIRRYKTRRASNNYPRCVF